MEGGAGLHVVRCEVGKCCLFRLETEVWFSFVCFCLTVWMNCSVVQNGVLCGVDIDIVLYSSSTSTTHEETNICLSAPNVSNLMTVCLYFNIATWSNYISLLSLHCKYIVLKPEIMK